MVNLHPSGKRGLMLGEILGLKAGLTRLLLDMLPRFLLVRPLVSDFREGNVEAKGELVVLVEVLDKLGAGVADPDGVLKGPSFGVFLEVDMKS